VTDDYLILLRCIYSELEIAFGAVGTVTVVASGNGVVARIAIISERNRI